MGRLDIGRYINTVCINTKVTDESLRKLSH